VREVCCNILPLIAERWSARALSDRPIASEDLRAVCEAARWAPSCYNDQPWLFMAATTPDDLATFRSFLASKNQRWANRAPVLLLILARTRFRHNGSPNRWAFFDAGTAWGYLSLEAWRRGIVAHAMAGFDAEKARKELALPAEVEPLAMVALGYLDDPGILSEEFRAVEKPGERRPLDEVLVRPDHFSREQ